MRGGAQFDVYVDFHGNFARRDINEPTRFNGVEVGPVSAGCQLIPSVLHSYRLEAADLPGYEAPDLD